MTADDIVPPQTSLEVRDRLVRALRLDLVGPGPADSSSSGYDYAAERLPGRVRPSVWYLTGFLIPSDAPLEQRSDVDEDERLDEVPESAGSADEDSGGEQPAARRGFFPSSMGLSFMVPSAADELRVTVRWGDYTAQEIEAPDGESFKVWQRAAREETIALPLAGEGEQARPHPVPASGGLELNVVERRIDTPELADLVPPGTRSVSVFLVNRRRANEDNHDETYAFQAEIEVSCPHPFVPRPDLRAATADDWDERVADLHYADRPEYAVGHGVSAEWETDDDACRLLRTCWLPSAEVERTEPQQVPGVCALWSM